MKSASVPMSLKPKALHIECPYCSQKNLHQVFIMGEILEKAVICAGCAKPFTFSLRWNPEIATHRVPGEHEHS